MKNCPSCKSPLPENESLKYCKECGLDLSQIGEEMRKKRRLEVGSSSEVEKKSKNSEEVPEELKIKLIEQLNKFLNSIIGDLETAEHISEDIGEKFEETLEKILLKILEEIQEDQLKEQLKDKLEDILKEYLKRFLNDLLEKLWQGRVQLGKCKQKLDECNILREIIKFEKKVGDSQEEQL